MYLSQLSLFRQDRLHTLVGLGLLLDRNFQKTEPGQFIAAVALCGSGEMDVFLHASGGYRTVNRRHSVSANLEDAGRGTGNIDSA